MNNRARIALVLYCFLVWGFGMGWLASDIWRAWFP